MTNFENLMQDILPVRKNLNNPYKVGQLFSSINKTAIAEEMNGSTTNVLEKKSARISEEPKLIGESSLIKEISFLIDQLADNKVNVLIAGCEGTSKELIARTLHHKGNKELPFVKVNCGAVSETLLEKEIFGHVKGSSPGAVRDKKGKLEIAGKGIIFLDEISELSLHLQGKLLKVILENEFEKVGGDQPIPFRARIIAASCKNLHSLVLQGQFREDLFNHLNLFTINIPPLSERVEDIPLLVNYYIKRLNSEFNKNIGEVPDSVMRFLINHKWIGNEKELENMLKRAVLLCTSNVLNEKCFQMQNDFDFRQKLSFNPIYSLSDVEKQYIQSVLEHTNWNIKKACDILKISELKISKKMKLYGIAKS